MARISIDSYAFDDPRFAILAEALRYRNRWQAIGHCLRVWHQCAHRTSIIRPVELAVLLGVRKPLAPESQARAVEAFVELAGLGEQLDDGSILVHGRHFDATRPEAPWPE